MTQLIVALSSPRARDRVASALRQAQAAGHAFELRRCDDWPQVRRAIRQADDSVALLDPYLEGSFAGSVLRRIRQRYPTLGIFLYGDFGGRPAREIAQLGVIGVIDVITLDVDDRSSDLAESLAKAPKFALLWQFLENVSKRYEPDVRQVLEHAITSRVRPLDPVVLAEVLGGSRKTLERKLKRANLPPPEKLLLWGRLLNAARLLEDPGRAVDRIAFSVGFSSPSALSATMKSYMRFSPTELRKRGPLTHAIRCFAKEIGA